MDRFDEVMSEELHAQKRQQQKRPSNVQKPTESIKNQREKDREVVRGIFNFYEVPGGTLSFCYKKYRGDEVQQFSLTHGQVYSLPLGVAKHLNKNGWYPVHSYQVDEHGKPTMVINRKKRRFGFQSLEFVDIDDIGESRSEESIVTAHFL